MKIPAPLIALKEKAVKAHSDAAYWDLQRVVKYGAGASIKLIEADIAYFKASAARDKAIKLYDAALKKYMAKL